VDTVEDVAEVPLLLRFEFGVRVERGEVGLAVERGAVQLHLVHQQLIEERGVLL